ncbi:MAG TPA: YkgJ family cysteine cluster protein [Proteobacteria bacterium]|mgnify:CR=1 FL=1|nr:YkgJ family cysteine cluster protein [Pseudomonadota bacterium]
MEEQKTGQTSAKKSMIEPTRYNLDSRFRFRCHKGVKCFTLCCRGINIILPPYDIIRIKNRLKVSSEEFLQKYTRLDFLGHTQLPVITLKMLDVEDGRCPFVTPDGCTIYSDRPSTCRYYPIGMTTCKEQSKEGVREEDFYLMVRENHCLGFQEDKEWTIEEWRKDQGVDIYDEMNRGWMEIILRKKSYGPTAELSKGALQMFFMVYSDIDKFRQFVFESSFLEKYDISNETRAKIESDELELMKFGFDWLKSALFGAEAVKLKDEVLQAKVREMREKAGQAASKATP